MSRQTIIFAFLLMFLGFAGYFATGMTSITALIPSFAGILFLIVGLVALKESLRMHAMHVAALLALLAIAGTAKGVIGTFSLISGGEVARPAAVITQAIMCILSAAYLAMSVRSFMVARVLKKKAAAS